MNDTIAHECPDEELLLAYGLRLLDGPGTAEMEQHLASCDACIAALALAKHRLQVVGNCLAPVPREVAEKVAATPHRAAATSAGGAPALQTARRARLPIPPRWSWPLALAAGLLLVVGVQVRPWPSSDASERTTRAIAVRNTLEVSARTAVVRKEPHPRAEVVATLRRGDTVTIGSEEREWYRVSLPDGTLGWVEQDAFR